MREDNFFRAAKITKLVFFLALVTAPVLSAPANPCQAEALSSSLPSKDNPQDSKTPSNKPENTEASKTQPSKPSQPAQTRGWEMLVAGIRDGKQILPKSSVLDRVRQQECPCRYGLPFARGTAPLRS